MTQWDPETEVLVALGRQVRDRVCWGARPADAGPVTQGAGDLQYPVDVLAEDALVQAVGELFAGWGPLRLLSEGLPEEGVMIRSGHPGRLLVVDPVDGTRGLIHDKRSAFFLAALAPDDGPHLRHITHAIMMEIPTSRSDLSDVIAGTAGRPPTAWTESWRDPTTRRSLVLRPSQRPDLQHGFATIVRFFGGSAEALGRFQDRLLQALHPDDPSAWMSIFEDQYISNAGQMHALMTGRDRAILDLRPCFPRIDGGRPLCAHPYDLLAASLARGVGVSITDPSGRDLDVPLDLRTDVAWLGYANDALRRRLAPVIRDLLQ